MPVARTKQSPMLVAATSWRAVEERAGPVIEHPTADQNSDRTGVGRREPRTGAQGQHRDRQECREEQPSFGGAQTVVGPEQHQNDEAAFDGDDEVGHSAANPDVIRDRGGKAVTSTAPGGVGTATGRAG